MPFPFFMISLNAKYKGIITAVSSHDSKSLLLYCLNFPKYLYSLLLVAAVQLYTIDLRQSVYVLYVCVFMYLSLLPRRFFEIGKS